MKLLCKMSNQYEKEFKLYKTKILSKINDDYDNILDSYYNGHITKKEHDILMNNLRYRFKTIGVATNYDIMKNNPQILVDHRVCENVVSISEFNY